MPGMGQRGFWDEQERDVAGADFTAGVGHLDEVTTGIELRNDVGVGVTGGSELLRREQQITWEVQKSQGIGCNGQVWGCCVRRHDPRALIRPGRINRYALPARRPDQRQGLDAGDTVSSTAAEAMTQQAFEQGDWQAVIDAHPLESHDPAEWLRYGAALLHTIEPGPEQGRQQQQAALAFVQAQKEGAPAEAVGAAQRQAVLLSLAQALNLAGVDRAAQQASEQARWHLQRIARLLRHPDKALIHTVHHLACTGGTVISKCLAAMPRVALVSEVNPLNRFGSDFEPTNPLLLLERSHRDLTIEEIKEDFLSRITQAAKICHNDGMDLVIRDHSHTDFCMGEAPQHLTPICDFLVEQYDLVSVVTVRHPLDSYLSLLALGWHTQFTPCTLEEYSRRYLAFLDRYSDLPLRRYEAFCAGPEAFMQELCELLELEYSPSFLERFGSIKLSGDSGRGSNSEITSRPRRPIPQDVHAELESSVSYRQLLERLGYVELG